MARNIPEEQKQGAAPDQAAQAPTAPAAGAPGAGQPIASVSDFPDPSRLPIGHSGHGSGPNAPGSPPPGNPGTSGVDTGAPVDPNQPMGAATKREPPKEKKYRVENNVSVMYGGARTQMPQGKVISNSAFDIPGLRQQGVQLTEVDEHGNPVQAAATQQPQAQPTAPQAAQVAAPAASPSQHPGPKPEHARDADDSESKGSKKHK